MAYGTSYMLRCATRGQEDNNTKYQLRLVLKHNDLHVTFFI